MPLWPTLFCVNLWLVALGVPLLLAAAAHTAAPYAWAAAPLGPLCLLFGLRYRKSKHGQAALLLGVPLLVLLPSADGALADPRLQPRSAVLLEVALLIGYLGSVCRALTITAPATMSKGPQLLLKPWQTTTLSARVDAPRLGRRIATHRLLIAYSVALPALLLYAIDFHPENLRTLRATFGSLRRVAAFQASVTAGLSILCSLAFYFGLMAPMVSYLEHHRELRTDLQALKRQARRGRPRPSLYTFMLLALFGMTLLVLWSFRQ